MKKRILKTTAVFLAVNMLAQVIAPTAAYALTGGPSQPEVQSFEPVGTTEMVDLFSGDFNYNIPLLDVEGYPINIAYHSGITMDQEASWVGLGWNINPGVINRNMRGLPDDFKNDAVTKDMYIKDNYTFGLGFGASVELFGIDLKRNYFKKVAANLSLSLGVFYNSYRGVGFEQTVAPSISAGDKLKFNTSLSISSSTQSGMTISPSTGMSLSKSIKTAESKYNGAVSFSVGASYNSRSGIKALTFSKGLSFKKTDKAVGQYMDRSTMYEANKGLSSGANNGGSSVSYANESYTPQISMPMTGVNVTFDAKFGTSFWGSDGSWDLKGYFSNQYIKEDARTIDKGGYGYLYASEARDQSDVLHDINREKDGSYSKANPNLPITMFSHDLYAVSGQGIGGMFRPYRGDVGQVHDDAQESNGNGGSLGIELGMGAGAKWGVSAVYNNSESKSHKWSKDEGNNLAAALYFKKRGEGKSPAFEPVYFKSAGEKTRAEESFLPYKNINQPLRPAFYTFNNVLEKKLSENVRGDMLIASDGNELGGNAGEVKAMAVSDTYRAARDPRNQAISYVTVAEQGACVEPGSMKSYKSDEKYPFTASSYDLLNRATDTRKDHHITEITALNPGGSRYVYGIAAYNNNQKEITFTNEGVTGTALADAATSGLVTYKTGSSNGYIQKRKGEEDGAHDGYYNATSLKGFAHSYLLTAVLSPDYVDLTGNGPSEDDLGNYTKMNYSRKSDEYKWRTPYNENKAMFHEAMKSDDSDDKGSIVYGEKEMWYVHSIETKNYIAEFNIFRREDAVGVKGVHGGKETSGTKQYSYGLKDIKLYTKAEKIANGSAAVPVKTVHFEYSYELCAGIINNTGSTVAGQGPYQGGVADVNQGEGKLTLKRIYFSYGNSNKGKLSAYEFDYGTNNPGYDVKAYDRWGNYKPNKSYTSTDTYLAATNSEFPYTSQQKNGSDQYEADLTADAWSLKEIKLPSGGKIKVTYEADDYAYVQDKAAMQMFGIRGFSEDGINNMSASRLYGEGSAQRNGFNWVHVNIPEGCESRELFEQLYIPDPYKPWDNTRYLFFNFLTCVKGNESRKEYVRGYAEIDHSTTIDNYIKRTDNYHYAIKVKRVNSEDSHASSYTINASPFAKAAWQYFRLGLPQYVYPGSNMKKDKGGGEAAMRSLLGIFFDAVEYIQGVNDIMLKKGFASHVDKSRCWVRLKNGTGFKKGGGVRVKKLELEDGWNTITNNTEEKSSYGQEYDYTIKVAGRDPISSGVASYEPMIGNEENPFRLPVMTSKENSLIPDESFYIEEPLGESFFPSASVGYSKVTVKNLSREGVTKHATGKVVNEFYTTKDFPTLVSRTNTQTHIKKPNWITGLATLKVKNHVTAVQGYQIELNDMNGKPKAEWVYEENVNVAGAEGKRISGKEYKYKTDADNSKHLNNNVKVARPDGVISEGPGVMVGVDAEMIFDSREQSSSSGSYGVDLNCDIILVTFLTVPIPVPIPSYSSEETRFRSAVLTRVIQRYGILETTIAYADNAAISTENLVYDAQTGEVLLTKTKNEYKDDIYNVSYPAHWVSDYDGMKQAYHNSDIVLNVNFAATNGTPNTGGHVTLGNNGNIPSGENRLTYLKEGDEIVVNNTRYWMTNDGYFMDVNGNTINRNGPTVLNMDIKVNRTVRRNLQSALVANIATRLNPITNVSGVNTLSSEYVTDVKEVLSASATTYSTDWKNYCVTSSELFANRGGFTPLGLVNAVNYLIKSGHLGTATTETNVTITSNSCCAPEYALYEQSFINKVFDNCGITDNFKYTYSTGTSPIDNSPFKKWDMRFPNCSYFTGTWGGQFPFDLYLPIDGCNTISAFPVRIEFLSSNIQYPLPYSMGNSVIIRAYFPGGCYVDGYIMVHGDTYRYGAKGYECVSKAPETNNRFAINEGMIWRKKRDLVFLTNRGQSGLVSESLDVRKHGIYGTFAIDINNLFNSSLGDWKYTSETTKYIPEGFEVETRDALNRYNSVLYETDLLPVAVANNAERREIGTDGFEYYNNLSSSEGCYERHWHFKKNPSSAFTIDNAVSHTGIRSMKLLAGGQVSNSYFTRGCGNPEYNYPSIMNSICEACLLPFNPYPKKEYVISGWVKTAAASNQGNVNDRNVSVLVTYNKQTEPVVVSVTPSGTIIEGWQRFEKKITIPEDGFTIDVTLKASPTLTTWFDDIRIYPFNGNMKTFVYDPATHRLMAELDENNYATFYEYDEQGALKRVKKETERGILTIKESRNHTSK